MKVQSLLFSVFAALLVIACGKPTDLTNYSNQSTPVMKAKMAIKLGNGDVVDADCAIAAAKKGQQAAEVCQPLGAGQASMVVEGRGVRGCTNQWNQCGGGNCGGCSNKNKCGSYSVIYDPSWFNQGSMCSGLGLGNGCYGSWGYPTTYNYNYQINYNYNYYNTQLPGSSCNYNNFNTYWGDNFFRYGNCWQSVRWF